MTKNDEMISIHNLYETLMFTSKSKKCCHRNVLTVLRLII